MKRQGKDSHIRYIKRAIEFILNNIFIILMTICLFFIIGHIAQWSNWGINFLRDNKATLSSGVDPQNQKPYYKLIFFGVEVIISPLIIFIFKKFLSKILARKKYAPKLRRRLYYCLNKRYEKSRNGISRTIIPKMINVFLHGKSLNFYNQNNHISKIVNYINKQNDGKHIVWIKGDAHSGKTTIIFKFIIDLTKENNLTLFQEYEKHIYYFDLGSPSLDVTNIYENISRGKYENALLILDNIHKLDLKELCSLITMLESSYDAIKFLICLSRQNKDFCFSEEISLRLDEFIRTNAEEIDVNLLQGDTTTIIDSNTVIRDEINTFTQNSNGDYQEFYNRIIKDNQSVNIALIVQCYNLFQSAPTRTDKEFIYKVFDALNKGEGDIVLKHTLSFIIFATLFSGGFELSWFYEYAKSIKQRGGYRKAKLYFRKLQKYSFISIVCASDSNEIVFHEKLARYYFELIDKSSKYKEINLPVVKYLLEKNKEFSRFANAWKYNVILQPAIPNDKNLFDKSLCVANFKTLLDDLKYLINEKNSVKCSFYRELGILYDRYGQLDQAAINFKKILENNFEPAIYINLVQVDHGEFIEERINTLSETKNDPYIKIAAKYWKAHIDIHNGIFHFKDFSCLLDEWRTQKDVILKKYPYDGLHLLRRWYFDCFRVYYLSGTANPDLLIPIIESRLFENIDNLPEFEAFKYKFQCAFFLHYDILFEKGMMNKLDYDKFERWETIMLQEGFCSRLKRVKEQGESEIDFIVLEAIKYYNASSDGLKKIMDKSYRYSDLRIRELKLAKEIVNSQDIWQNEDYFKRYIEHSKEIKVDEYIAYGYTYLLKNYLVGQFCLSTEYDDNPSEGRILHNLYITDDLIQDCFKNIEKFHNKYRGEKQNKYCLFRLQIYKTIYDYMKNSTSFEQAENRIKEMVNEADAIGYHREKKLLEYLFERKLNRLDIINFYKYYPLVLQ